MYGGQMRILVAMMKHETNTFSPIPTSLDRFFEWGGHLGDDAYHAYKGTSMPFSAYIDCLLYTSDAADE